MNPLAQSLGTRLREKGWTLSVAESCTAGALGAAVTSVPGASSYFVGGVIAYDNNVKGNLLAVPRETMVQFGAVSSQTVSAMADGCRKLFATDLAIGVTGIAGPGGGTPEKPVGRVFVAVASSDAVRGVRLDLKGDREAVRAQAVAAALDLAVAFLEE
jgi:PncC family amidohydrolase